MCVNLDKKHIGRKKHMGVKVACCMKGFKCSSRVEKSLAQDLYQRRGSFKVLSNILVVAKTALFWTEITDVVPGICSS